MTIKKTKKAPAKPKKVKPISITTFYIYKWSNGYTTFLVAESPEQALAKIRRNRGIACPPEIQDETVSKRYLAEASPDFILTVGGANQDEASEEEEKKALN